MGFSRNVKTDLIFHLWNDKIFYAPLVINPDVSFQIFMKSHNQITLDHSVNLHNGPESKGNILEVIFMTFYFS